MGFNQFMFPAEETRCFMPKYLCFMESQRPESFDHFITNVPEKWGFYCRPRFLSAWKTKRMEKNSERNDGMDMVLPSIMCLITQIF